jgi:hypothetical protein
MATRRREFTTKDTKDHEGFFVNFAPVVNSASSPSLRNVDERRRPCVQQRPDAALASALDPGQRAVLRIVVFADTLPRRAALAALVGLVAAALAACNSMQPTSAEPQAGAPAVKIAVIKVDTSALSALSVDPTAT